MTNAKTLKDNLGSLDLVIKNFTFQSQGDLAVCVAAFRKWYSYLAKHLIIRYQEQVDAIEQTKNTNLPTVKTILLCHSMGGIIAVDSLFAMIDDNDRIRNSILGILAYDTPYFGLNPPVIHRTISNRVNTISSAVNTAREWVPKGIFASKSAPQVTASASQPAKPFWGVGRTLAAVGAGVAAVGALSYLAREPIVNHLQFVGVLYKSDELARRMKRLSETRSVGFAVFYTVVTAASAEDGGEVTFCIIPADKMDGKWIRQENGLAKDEVEAHCGMFSRSSNDHYAEMCKTSLQIIARWIGAAG